MVRKIKVVNINEIQPIETINQNDIGRVILNDEEDIVEDPVINTSSEEEIEPVQAKSETTHIELEPRSLQDLANEIIQITKETTEDLRKIKIDKKPEKDLLKIPCPNCMKMMSTKSLRYSHQKNCKIKPINPSLQADIPEQTPEPIQIPPSITLPIPSLKSRPTKQEIKQQRISSLISQAFLNNILL